TCHHRVYTRVDKGRLLDVADSSNSGNNSSPAVADNPAGYTDPQQPSDDLPGPNKGKLAENTRQRQEQADQQEALANGAGFQFDPDELRHLRDEWQDLAKDLDQLRAQTSTLGQANPPADEQASRDQIKAVYQHARVCNDIHNQMYQYARQYADRLDTALNQLHESDAAARDSVRATGREM